MATPARHRIGSLDFVRGLAVMGILIMNIHAFAMPEGVYYSPRTFGGDTGLDLVSWGVNFVLFDGKMRGLFELLFGASAMLVMGRSLSAHFSRLFWLALAGLAHFYFIWFGDILFFYAAAGLFLPVVRDFPVSKLLATGFGLVILSSAASLLVNGSLLANPDPDNAAMIDSYADFYGGTAASVARSLALFQSGYGEIFAYRTGPLGAVPFFSLVNILPDTVGMMMLGMAAFKSGLFSTWDDARLEKWGFGLFLGAGAAHLPLLAWQMASGFEPLIVVTVITGLGPPLFAAMALGWAALLVRWYRRVGGSALGLRISAAGRMAFTNYIATSIVMTTIFYGYGLGLFGSFGRAQLALFVIAMWAAMLLWSRPWLARFAYGPVEWLWRSLSRGALQPMRR